ncbi:SDR family NAD(P)-dependent oxidoreductase [Paenibacillus woosongensis]|uniref:SDR family NAD(P)-dependent oxidoreductase n=1 Tax=Paenibacillus woosongensis TaxID=307580 RepID=A0AA95L122_9BACL|nr:SDR family NAD(P)-dependent oxidoreductase [Paenibacillus woosongensis]WHX47067.1 SDR family NAD(P)-dependent oxidoreductase [Paenibacillus woosongensis]
MHLNQQTAVITGSSRGIGRAIALRMAQEGARVVVNGTDASRVNAVVEEIRQNGGVAIGIAEPVHTMEGGARIISAATAEFGQVDILVNNAGIIRDQMAHKLGEEDWDAVISIHLKGAFSCIRAALPGMRERRQGCIINMTSTAGLTGTAGQLNYSAAKAGLLGMTWTLALELRHYGISVNAIAPAALTDMTAPYIERARRDAEAAGQNLPDYWRVGTPEEAAELAVALSLPQTRGISGEIFSVNGGDIGLWARPKHELLTSRTSGHWKASEIAAELLTESLN